MDSNRQNVIDRALGYHKLLFYLTRFLFNIFNARTYLALNSNYSYNYRFFEMMLFYSIVNLTPFSLTKEDTRLVIHLKKKFVWTNEVVKIDWHFHRNYLPKVKLTKTLPKSPKQ